MIRYPDQSRILLAVDCLIFGLDNNNLKLLLIQRTFEPGKRQWSLIGGFLQRNESLDNAAKRVLKKMTGLNNIYMEPFHTFSDPNRDPVERTVSVAYFSFIDISQFSHQMHYLYKAKWFRLNDLPELIFDHQKMVNIAKMQIEYRASLNPITFELLPEIFTISQLYKVYENIYGKIYDEQSFEQKMISTGLLIKHPDENKTSKKNSKHYYKLDRDRYYGQFNNLQTIVPQINNYIFGKSLPDKFSYL
ncbi:NrtR DNA-binding winged helix domain-containing protein [Mucilaginibacter sp.]|uniref:NUDIX hydrolase n=1 Tax=Mucilaginibacter sp. TaxID=1882438 RepID=UPI00284C0F5D|nr:NUDIX domain-containing protein [Mucilaginibacter sp.]MDR3693206.1 NUDIX domain-containing protein [Mucilaginibacter sp.]